MDMSLLEPKSVVSSPFSSFRHQVQRFSRCSSCIGRFSRASYSNGVPNKAYCSGAVSSIGQDKLPAEGFTHQINGTNGLSSNLFSRDCRLLDAVDDQYDGIVIDPNGLPSNPVVFSSNLRFSLSHWKKKGKKGVWLKLLVEQSELIPIALKIETEFIEVIAFRHAHNIAFEKSDLFFVCMLRPLSTEIIVDDLEIQAAKWMPLAEFVEQSLVKEDVMFKKIIDICIARLDKYYCGLNVHQLVSKFDGKLSSLYYNTIDGEDLTCTGK